MDARQAQIKSLLDQHLGAGTPHKNGEVSYHCPFCNHYKKKLQVNLSSLKWHCWIDNNRGNNLISLLKKSKASPTLIKQVAELTDFVPHKSDHKGEEKRVALPDDYTPIWKANTNSPHFKNALWYLTEKRKLTKYDILKYQIGYCERGEYSGMVIVPSYDENHSLNYFVGRSYYPDAPFKHKNPDVSKDVIGFESLIDWTQPITIVEGSFDAIATKRNTIPLFGKKILPKLKQKVLEHRVQTVYIGLDPDALSSAISEVEYFMNCGIDVRLINLTDKDPADTGFEGMLDLCRSTTQLDLFDLVKLKMAI